MKSLMILEMSLLEENNEGVGSYLEEIDRATANDLMTAAGEAFGFKTFVANGIVITHMGLLAKNFGYADVSSMKYLVNAYHLQASRMGWYGVELHSKLRKTFNLSPKDSKATFVTWDTFLVAGMCGKGDLAKKVKIYLLKMETTARISVATSPDRMKYEEHRSRQLCKQITFAIKLSRMPEGPHRESATEAYEQLIGKKLPPSPQLKLIK